MAEIAESRPTAIQMHLAAIKATGHTPLHLVEVTDLVEAAILAERERAAKIADRVADVENGEASLAAADIASSIRSQSLSDKE